MLSRKKRYLQIALNSTLNEARSIISQIPLDERLIIEAGTPLIKTYGAKGIKSLRGWWETRFIEPEQRMFRLRRRNLPEKPKMPFVPYIVADLKCMDRGRKEVELSRDFGASAAVALGYAPIETIDSFIENCRAFGLDSMIDMLNVEFPLAILRKLKTLPAAVILHRGVDEEEFNPEKEIPYYEITRIKNEYDILVAVAGGDTFQEVQRAVFNDADIVVVWKSFYKSTADTAKLAEQFLREIR